MSGSTRSVQLPVGALARPDAPDFDRADRIGEFYGNPKTRTFAELLIDAEEDPYLRAVHVRMLRGGDKAPLGSWPHVSPRCRASYRF